MLDNVKVVPHESLSSRELVALRALFDREYLADYGSWCPDAPYGYSPAEMHVMLFSGARLTAHVGFQVRKIIVGGAPVTVAGIGGVLVDDRYRGTGLGGAAMARVQEAMRAIPAVSFGYLGCREGVVAFYESAGWSRVHAVERCVSRTDQRTILTSKNSPIMILPVHAGLGSWPSGAIDLRGTPW